MTQMIAHTRNCRRLRFLSCCMEDLEGGQGGDALKDPRPPPPISRFAAHGAAAADAPAGDGGCGDIDLRRGGSSRLLDGN